MTSFDNSLDLAEAPRLSTDVGALLELGLALGHQRFEVVSLADHGPDEADSQDSRSVEYSEVDMVMSKEAPGRDPYLPQRYHGAIREFDLCVEVRRTDTELMAYHKLHRRRKLLTKGVGFHPIGILPGEEW